MHELRQKNGKNERNEKFKDNWQKYFGPALGIGAVFLIWYLVCRMEMVSCVCAAVPGAGVDEPF